MRCCCCGGDPRSARSHVCSDAYYLVVVGVVDANIITNMQRPRHVAMQAGGWGIEAMVETPSAAGCALANNVGQGV